MMADGAGFSPDVEEKYRLRYARRIGVPASRQTDEHHHPAMYEQRRCPSVFGMSPT